MHLQIQFSRRLSIHNNIRLNTAYGIAIDASNYIYVADYGANTVIKYNTSGTQQLSLPTANLSAPSGVAVDQSGNIYVVNYTSGKVGENTLPQVHLLMRHLSLRLDKPVGDYC